MARREQCLSTSDNQFRLIDDGYHLEGSRWILLRELRRQQAKKRQEIDGCPALPSIEVLGHKAYYLLSSGCTISGEPASQQ